MDSIFSANEPTLGYLHQIRYGLMLILDEPNDAGKLLIEKIDDISIETNGIIDVYQLKLHINSVANLTNGSTDLWKTLRVWSEGINTGSLDPVNSLFTMITTAASPKGTIPSMLKPNSNNERNVEEILKELISIAKDSGNATNKKSYDSFLSLTEEQQKALINNINIIDSSLDINGSKAMILQRLKFSTLNVGALFERLEGWFMGQVILQLQNARDEITAKEVRNRVLDIADSLKSDNLPNDFNTPIPGDDTKLDPYRNQTFVAQLSLINVNQRMINHAIGDYYRAFSQKSRWLREGLITPDDDLNYNKRLYDDWDNKFAIISDSVEKDEPEVQSLNGRNFYQTHYVSTCPQIFIKERFREDYMVRGCCHMLADRKQIGWHPDYENQI